MSKILLALMLLAVNLLPAQNSIVKSVNTPMVLSSFDTIHLLAPDTLSGMPLMQAISRRKTDREFDNKNLSLKHLSEVLWVANGINRTNGKRTVPSAMARYPIQTYAILSNGIYFYNVNKHQLEPVVKGDYRSIAGTQTFVENAPLNLLYIAKATNEKDTYTGAMLDSGYCGQNVYLYCASEGLKTVVRGKADQVELFKALKFENGYKFILAQTVGY